MDEGAALYSRYLNGDENAFDQLVRLYRKDVTLYANSITKNYTLAEDAAIDAFSELVYKKGKYNYSIPFKSFLFMICRRRAIDKIRKERRFVGISDRAISDENIYEKAENDEKREMLKFALENLPEKQRSAVYFVYFEGLSYEQTAVIMKINPKKVDNLLFQAKKRLKEELKNKI